MIEFATDKKATNLQLTPRGKDAITIKGTPFLSKSSSDEWIIPSTMYPIDLHEIDLADTTSEVKSSDNHIIKYSNTMTYYLNPHGLYKFISLEQLHYSNFINNEQGYEIVESKNENDQFVYTIRPNHRDVYESLSLGSLNLIICLCFIRKYDEYRYKITGTIPYGSKLKIEQSENTEYLENISEYVLLTNITDMVNTLNEYTLTVVDSNDNILSQSLIVEP